MRMSLSQYGYVAGDSADTDPAISSVRGRAPEESGVFRIARMLLFFDVARTTGRQLPSLDRLGYYEFFADNPFTIIDGSKRSDPGDIQALQLAGFTQVRLDYASTGPRFASRRRRLQQDLATLVAYGLATLTGEGYAITDRGQDIAAQFRSAYADAYRTSAEIVLRRLAPLSAKSLEVCVEQWLGHSALLLDLLEDVNDADAPPLSLLEPENKDGDTT